MIKNNFSYGDFPINPDHLAKLGKTERKYQDILDKINENQNFYMYDQANEIINHEIYPRFQDADEDKNYRGRICFLYGDYNTGKSFLVRYCAGLIFHKYNVYWKDPNSNPIHIIDLRDDINTAKQFLLFLLSQLGYPIDPLQLKSWDRSHVTEIRLREKVISILELRQTRILILDECQRLLKARNPNIPNIFECIKDLTNRKYWNGALRTSIFFCGTHDGLPLLEAADWIQGRAHSIRMMELSDDEYPDLLWTIYLDYIDMGISSEWNFTIIDKDTHERVLNPELVSFLHQRTEGKVGLTVEIIRDAVKRALYRGQLHPDLDDYKLVIIEGKDYNNIELEENNTNKKPDAESVVIGYKDRLCTVEGCFRSREPYKSFGPLLPHYKKKHPAIKIVNKAGGRM